MISRVRVRVICDKSQSLFRHFTMILMAFAHSFGLIKIQCGLNLSVIIKSKKINSRVDIIKIQLVWGLKFYRLKWRRV